MKRYVLLDGERRLRAAILGNLKDMDAVVLSEKPSLAELHIIQASIDAHRQHLSLMERSNLYCCIQRERGWNASEVAKGVNLSQSLVSKVLTFQKGNPDIQKLLHLGELDVERGYLICQEPDFVKQYEILKAAKTCSREELRQKVKAKTNGAEVKASVAKFMMPGGVAVTLQGAEITLSRAIEVLSETVKQLKKALGQGLDVSTVQAVFRDQAKAR
jgi:ParB-like chromosome segregation protein Spo0J